MRRLPDFPGGRWLVPRGLLPHPCLRLHSASHHLIIIIGTGKWSASCLRRWCAINSQKPPKFAYAGLTKARPFNRLPKWLAHPHFRLDNGTQDGLAILPKGWLSRLTPLPLPCPASRPFLLSTCWFCIYWAPEMRRIHFRRLSNFSPTLQKLVRGSAFVSVAKYALQKHY
jgi:hypothetical protein